MADSFFIAPSAELNQGDIVDHIPWGLIEAPTTLCRPNDRGKASGKAFYGSVQELKTPAPWTHDPEYVHGLGWEGIAMVLWHGCQIDKWKNSDAQTGRNTHARSFAAVAPVLPLESFRPVEGKDEIRRRRHYSYFPLPAVTLGQRTIPESYVDLRHMWSVRQSILVDRLVSITDQARLSLYEHLFTFFTRYRLNTDPRCPTCGATVPLVPVAEDAGGV